VWGGKSNQLVNPPSTILQPPGINPQLKKRKIMSTYFTLAGADLIAAENLPAARVVTWDTGELALAADETEVPVGITMDKADEGDSLSVYALGSGILVESTGAISQGALVMVADDGSGKVKAATGYSGMWTVGTAVRAAAGGFVRIILNPQYHAVDAT